MSHPVAEEGLLGALEGHHGAARLSLEQWRLTMELWKFPMELQ